MNLDRLNENQREAVLYLEGPLLILAGAGSGKTSTMTHRIVHMLESGISKYNILAVTFTNKAATEMRDRVESLVGSCNGMWILTFHAMGLRMLRRDAHLLGYGQNFVVYDTQDQKTIIKNIIKDFNINDKDFPVNYLISVISKAKEQSKSPDALKAEDPDNYRTEVIFNVYREYKDRLRKNNAMDFDDLLLNTLKLLEKNEDILIKYQDRFKYVMVDEYQDTNFLQYRIIKLLSENHQNLCVVGDDDQCIYEWRGADIRNILDFEKDFPDAKTIKLEQNYRSKGNILAGAHSVIENNVGRKKKKLWTDKEDGHKITYYRSDTEKDEARYIVQEIDFLRGNYDSLSQFAILYRTNAQSRVFEQAFAERRIPYRILSGMRYYDRKEIKDLMAYMRLVINPKDELALIRVINQPKRGVGAKTIETLQGFAKAYDISILEALEREDILSSLSAKARPVVREMVTVLKLCREEEENLRVSDIYDELLMKTGYMKSLEETNTPEAESRIENLMEFKTVIGDYEKEVENPNLAEFMEKITLMAEVDNHDDNVEAVVLMTMHSSKGLEFPVVFLPGMEDGLFPGHRALDNIEGLEEERRLCYVGMTRAKERLFLTSAETRTLYGRTDYTRESQFLRELDPKLLEGDGVYRTKKDETIGVYTGSKDGYNSKVEKKPFDLLSYATQSTKSNVSSGKIKGDSFKVGDKVKHTKFGSGLVVEEDEKTISVMFDSVGKKRLGKGILHLSRD